MHPHQLLRPLIGRTVTYVRDMTQQRLLGGRYELDGMVGRGGMAEVFRARDIRLNRIVGVKTLRNDLARDEMVQARFRREAQSAASLNHPSIVAVYDTGEDMVGGTPVPYIVMEFVHGRTLRELLSDDGIPPPERAAEITDGVLRALDYSHRNGIVHRDIKPGNVMLARSGGVKVMDFGIARPVSDAELRITQTAQVVGTAQYLSPEQARGGRVDARSDLYSTGCLLYELLTGRPPFTGDSPVDIAYRHVTEDPVPPSRVAPEVPGWADAIVLRALQKDPARRYQSPAEMHGDIRRALAGSPVAQSLVAQSPVAQSPVAQSPVAQSPVAGSPVAASPRKTWLWITLAVAVALAVVIAGITFLKGSNNEVGVPSVTGMSLVRAEDAVSGTGLRVGRVSYMSSASVAKTDVISTNPSHGTQVSKGSAVNLVVSKGRVPVASHLHQRHSRSASPTPSPGASSAPTGSSSTPASPGPSPSASCVVNILGFCV